VSLQNLAGKCNKRSAGGPTKKTNAKKQREKFQMKQDHVNWITFQRHRVQGSKDHERGGGGGTGEQEQDSTMKLLRKFVIVLPQAMCLCPNVAPSTITHPPHQHPQFPITTAYSGLKILENNSSYYKIIFRISQAAK